MTIPIRDARLVPGPWWAWVQRDGKPMLQMKCPNGHIADLIDHAVDDSGLVNPSIVCPETGCDYHVVNVILEAFYRVEP